VNHFLKDLASNFELMEDQLSDNKTWFAGNKIGLADFNMLFGVGYVIAHKFLDTNKYSKIAKWHDTITGRPAYKRAMEKGRAYDLLN
jgi:glutathione S-transferase